MLNKEIKEAVLILNADGTNENMEKMFLQKVYRTFK